MKHDTLKIAAAVLAIAVPTAWAQAAPLSLAPRTLVLTENDGSVTQVHYRKYRRGNYRRGYYGYRNWRPRYGYYGYRRNRGPYYGYRYRPRYYGYRRYYPYYPYPYGIYPYPYYGYPYPYYGYGPTFSFGFVFQ